MSMGDEEEEEEKVFYLVSNILKDNITTHSWFLTVSWCFQYVYWAWKTLFWFIHFKHALFVSEYSRLNSYAEQVTYGVDKIMLLAPIQTPRVLPKSYLLAALVKIKRKAASFSTKNRNVVLLFFCAFQMRATFMKQFQHAALHPAPPGIRCQSTNILCQVSAVLWKSIIQIYCQLCFTRPWRLQSLHIYAAPMCVCESYDEDDLWVPEKKTNEVEWSSKVAVRPRG